MTNNTNSKKFDLEERTLKFSIRIIDICKKIPNTTINRSLVSQLVRSSTSIGANYREANDALGKKDFVHRLRIARKEAKETIYWIELVMQANIGLISECQELVREAIELRNILSAIIRKSE